jgi:hypothetical protein
MIVSPPEEAAATIWFSIDLLIFALSSCSQDKPRSILQWYGGVQMKESIPDALMLASREWPSWVLYIFSLFSVPLQLWRHDGSQKTLCLAVLLFFLVPLYKSGSDARE